MVGEVVADHDGAVLLQGGIDLFTAQREQHLPDFFPILGVVRRDFLCGKNAHGFFVKQAEQQILGRQAEQFFTPDRTGKGFDASPAVGVALVGVRHFLQEQPGDTAG